MSIVATYLQDLRVQYPSNLDRDELRVTQTGLLTMALRMTDEANSIVSADFKKKAKNSQGRTLNVPVMVKNDVTISNVRSCVIASDESTTGYVSIQWQTLVANIVMTPSQYDMNEINYLTDLNRKMTDRVEKLLVTMEEVLDTTLDANKTQVYGSTIVGDEFAIAGGAIQVEADEQKTFFNFLDPINYADDFYSTNINVVGSHALMAPAKHFVNQGSSNSENLAYSFAGKNFTFSNRISNGAGKSSTFYFMPSGTLGVLTRVDSDARRSAKSTKGTQWSEERINGLPFTVGIRYESDCADESDLNGVDDPVMAHLTATLKEKWQISFDFAVITPYNSDPSTKAGAIRKVEFIPNVVV